MKSVIIGAHLRRDDIEPLAEVLPAADVFLSGLAVADDQPLGDRELLLRVAKVRAALLERATFIAIRYGFAASSANESTSTSGPTMLATPAKHSTKGSLTSKSS